MVCFYSVYLLIMYFNPRIEAWLYKVTNTNSPEYKSELHATNGKKNGYSQLAADDTTDSESKRRDENDEEKTDAGKETTEKESKDQEQSKKEEAAIKDHKGYPGKQFVCNLMSFQINITKCQVSLLFVIGETLSSWLILVWIARICKYPNLKLSQNFYREAM